MSTETSIEPGHIGPHSAAWVMQTQLTFGVAIFAMGWAIFTMSIDLWAKGYLAMGTLLAVVSSINLAKTLRDEHESQRVSRRVEGAKIERFLAEHDPLRA